MNLNLEGREKPFQMKRQENLMIREKMENQVVEQVRYVERKG